VRTYKVWSDLMRSRPSHNQGQIMPLSCQCHFKIRSRSVHTEVLILGETMSKSGQHHVGFSSECDQSTWIANITFLSNRYYKSSAVEVSLNVNYVINIC
jgi:hypothetical protein